MNDTNRRERIKAEKERLKRRIRVTVDPNKYEYIPEKKPFDVFEDIDTHQRVGIYARVSTDNLEQTSSYELQKKYYEEFVTKHPNWKLVEIYADEGISGTFLRKRKNFLRMIEDAKAGKLDLIVTKSVSRFARNVEDFLGTIRELTHLKHPVGVLFEMEMIFSLKDESKMALSFHATIAVPAVGFQAKKRGRLLPPLLHCRSVHQVLLLAVDQLRFHDLLGAVADIVHPSNPFHLVRPLELLRHAFRLRHLLRQGFHHVECLLVDLQQMLGQRSLHQHGVVGSFPMLLQEAFPHPSVSSDLALRLLVHHEVREKIVSHLAVGQFHRFDSFLLFQLYSVRSVLELQMCDFPVQSPARYARSAVAPFQLYPKLRCRTARSYRRC